MINGQLDQFLDTGWFTEATLYLFFAFVRTCVQPVPGMGTVRLYARTHDLTTLLKKGVVMINDLNAAVSPAALTFPAIDIVIRDQVVALGVLR